MSTELVSWAMTRNLSPRAKVVLLCMANQAQTRDRRDVPARTYFGGWEALGLALDPDQEWTPARRHLAVARCVRELSAAGCVKPVDNPTGGDRRWYRITP